MILTKKNRCPTCNQTLRSKTSTAYSPDLALRPRQTSDLISTQVNIPLQRAIIFGALCGAWGFVSSMLVYIYLYNAGLLSIFWATVLTFMGGLSFYWLTDQTDYKDLVKPEQLPPVFSPPAVSQTEMVNDFVPSGKNTLVKFNAPRKDINTFAYLALVERRNISRAEFCDNSKQVRMTATGYNKLYKQLTGAGMVVRIENKNEITRPGRAYLRQFTG